MMGRGYMLPAVQLLVELDLVDFVFPHHADYLRPELPPSWRYVSALCATAAVCAAAKLVRARLVWVACCTWLLSCGSCC